MVAGVYAIPRLIHLMGESRFGLLTIIWGIIGYFSYLDFGIGRAITFRTSRALGFGESEKVRSIYWTGSVSLAGIGIIMGVLIGSLFPLIFIKFMKIPADLQAEFFSTISWIGFSIPILTLTAAPRGILESYHKFSLINLLKIPFGILMFVLPLLFPSKIQNLSWVVMELVILRLVWLIFHFMAVQWSCPIPISATRFSTAAFRDLVKFGGWITVTNFIAPIVNLLDRFFISILASASAVVFYTTPFEVINRLTLIPASLTAVLFPTLGKQLIEDPKAAKKLYFKSKNVLWIIVFTLAMFVVVFGNPLMKIWINETFANKSKFVIVFITAGVFINGLAHLPFTYMQCSGSPKEVALLNVAEVIIFIPTLIILIHYAGVVGASIAWFLRALIDYIILEYMTYKRMGEKIKISIEARIFVSLIIILIVPIFNAFYIRGILLIFILIYLYNYYKQNATTWGQEPPTGEISV